MKISSATPNRNQMENEISSCQGANHSRIQIPVIRRVPKMFLRFKIFFVGCIGCYLYIAHNPCDIVVIVPFHSPSFGTTRIKKGGQPSAPTNPVLYSLILPMPAHKFFHAMQGFLDFAIFRSIAHAREPFTTWSKCIARHNGHMFFAQ